MKSLMSVSLGVVLLCFVTVPVHANLITDGSFETPLVPAGSFTSFTSGTTIPGTSWTVTGPTSTQVSIVSGTFTQNGFIFPAQDGAQWLDLTGNGSNSTEGVQQVVATTPGTAYSLSYFVGNVVNPGGIFGTSSTVNVFVNGSLQQVATYSGGGLPQTLEWEQFSTTFLAGGSTTTIRFENGDGPSDNSNGLDNIVMEQAPDRCGGAATRCIPEPATLLLLGSGLATLVGFTWRRHRCA